MNIDTSIILIWIIGWIACLSWFDRRVGPLNWYAGPLLLATWPIYAVLMLISDIAGWRKSR